MTALGTLVAVVGALPAMGLLVGLAYLTFHHDHSRGHCGWAGCQAKETP